MQEENTIEVEFLAPEEFRKKANIQNENLYKAAGGNHVAFWEACAETLKWSKKWHTVLEWNLPFAKWFLGGRLNVSENCLDRFIKTPIESKVAYHFVSEDGHKKSMTYKELYLEVNRLANAFKELGVKKGDTVAIYMPLIPEAICAMLAASRIGAVHTVIFGGFSAEALRARIKDCNAKLLITADASIRKGKPFLIKPVADQAVKEVTCLEKVIVVKNSGAEVSFQQGRDVWYHEIMKEAESFCKPLQVNAEDPLFILYTSGTTGRPKGIVHSSGGYLVGASTSTKLVFDIKKNDIFWCTADIGWITGHSYVVYGPLSNGLTSVVYEGGFYEADQGKFYDIIDQFNVTTLYTAPTLIRTLMKWGEEPLVGKDLSSLRLLGSVGEPLNPEAWRWYYQRIGLSRCPIVDTWWQTETGSIMISSIPSIHPMKPGFVGNPLPGIDAAILNSSGELSQEGFLAIRSPWPSMLIGVYGDNRRFIETYWNTWGGRYYFSGDNARQDNQGFISIAGRCDDAINVAAHRLGTMELESALTEHPSVAEAAVIGIPDPIKGEDIVAFVVLKHQSSDQTSLKKELEELLIRKIGKLAKPKQTFIVEDLPKTRSGKIMRRLLKNLSVGKSLGDTTTLEKGELVEALKKSFRTVEAERKI